MRIVGRRYDTGTLVAVELTAGRIARITPLSPEAVAALQHGAELPWLAPGLVDLQHNGYGGREFNEGDLTLDDIERIVLAQDAYGLVGFCPTTTTHSHATLVRSLETIAAACRRSEAVARRVAGIHVEGPYISREDGPRGAHPLAHVRPPDWSEFCELYEAADGRIRILTLSPEYDGAAEFIRRVVDLGVLVAIGHTNATSDQIRAAVDAGASFSTHLGNAAHPRIRRHPNYIWDQLAEDRLHATLIVDGHHLPPTVVKSFLRVKSPERCLLISDITGMAGMAPGRYERTSLGAVEVLDDGKLVVAGQRDLLAGASLPLFVGIVNVMRFAGLDLRTAVEMASVHPAAFVGRPVPRLEVGAPADLIQFHLDSSTETPALRAFQLVGTILAGEAVYGSPCVAQA